MVFLTFLRLRMRHYEIGDVLMAGFGISIRGLLVQGMPDLTDE